MEAALVMKIDRRVVIAASVGLMTLAVACGSGDSSASQSDPTAPPGATNPTAVPTVGPGAGGGDATSSGPADGVVFNWRVETVDEGAKPAIALASDGTPYVAYMREAISGFVKAASKTGDLQLLPRVLGDPHRDRPVLDRAIQRLEILAHDLVQRRRLGSSRFVSSWTALHAATAAGGRQTDSVSSGTRGENGSCRCTAAGRGTARARACGIHTPRWVRFDSAHLDKVDSRPLAKPPAGATS